ncbi:hypothetical protein RHO13_01845 [Orbus wheelerorum]|uniref:hypothetical protein n=1 Tax=Orbus wheelerorum TaxID=3074111 RepID=UPI00370D6AF1
MDDLCLHQSNIKTIIKVLMDLVLSGKRYRLVIKIWKDKRSIDQNSLSHMWYDDIAKQVNDKLKISSFTLESVKKDLKEMFLGYEEVEHTNVITGKKTYTHELIKTSGLDKGDMHIYLKKIEVWAYQEGLRLRIPNECEYQKLKDEQVK